jgi:hypothetical protein
MEILGHAAYLSSERERRGLPFAGEVRPSATSGLNDEGRWNVEA